MSRFRQSRMGVAALVVSAGILLSRLLGFARDVVMTALLGATVDSDIYFAAFFIPDILFYLMAGGYLSITFIPILTRIGDEPAEINKAFTAVAKPITSVMAALTAAAMVWADRLVDLVYVRFVDLLPGSPTATALGPAELAQVTDLTRIVLPAQLFFMVGSLLMAVQYAQRHFLVPSLAPVVYNLGIIVGGAIGYWTGTPGPAGFAWGALAGAVAGNFLLQAAGARRLGLRWVSGTPWRTPVLSEYLLLAIPLMLGQSIAVLDEQFVRVFGQSLGEAAISELNYGRRLTMLPVGVIAQAAGVAAYPFLAELAANERWTELRAKLHEALRYTVFAGLGATALVLATSQVAVRVAFQRANFDSAATIGTATALALFSLAIPLWGAHQIYARGFYALRRMWTPVIVGTVWTALAIPLYVVLIDSFGQRGLPMASVAAMAGYTLTLAAVWYRDLSTDGLAGLGSSLARGLAAAAPAGAAGWWVAGNLATPIGEVSLGRGAIALLAAAVVTTAVFVIAARLVRSPELNGLLQRSGSL